MRQKIVGRVFEDRWNALLQLDGEYSTGFSLFYGELS
jgi:hypothetical protein